MEVDDAISSITETIKTAKKIAEIEIVPEPMQLFPDLDLLIKEKKRVRKRWQRLRQAGDTWGGGCKQWSHLACTDGSR